MSVVPPSTRCPRPGACRDTALFSSGGRGIATRGSYLYKSISDGTQLYVTRNHDLLTGIMGSGAAFLAYGSLKAREYFVRVDEVQMMGAC